MFNTEIQKEMLADGFSGSRRKIFARQKFPSFSQSFDDYLQFLNSIQNVFPSPARISSEFIKKNNYKI